LHKLKHRPEPAILLGVAFGLYILFVFLGWYIDVKDDSLLQQTYGLDDGLPLDLSTEMTMRPVTVAPVSPAFMVASEKDSDLDGADETKYSRNFEPKLTRWEALRQNIRERLTTRHRWLCVFFRKRGESFTRPKRITIVFDLIMTSLACNAIFYQARHSPFELTIGERFLVAFWSALLVVPINLTIFLLLSKSELMGRGRVKKVEPEDEEEDLKKRTRWVRLLRRLRLMQENKWPWWCGLIGYILFVCIVLLSAYLVLLYVLDFNDRTLDGWLTSSFLSIGQDIVLNQPISNLMGAVFGSTIAGASRRLVGALGALFRNLFNL